MEFSGHASEARGAVLAKVILIRRARDSSPHGTCSTVDGEKEQKEQSATTEDLNKTTSGDPKSHRKRFRSSAGFSGRNTERGCKIEAKNLAIS